MARRAMWRRAADDPAGAFGYVARALVELRSLVLLFGLVLVGLAWVSGIPQLLGVIPMALLLVNLLPYRSPRRSDGLATLPLPNDSFPVMVTILQGRLATGADDAVATFVEGWLHVEGRRASFSLRATDGQARVLPTAPVLGIALRGGTSVRIEPIQAVSAKASSEVGSFLREARAWVASRAAPPGEPILPPLDVQPEVYARVVVRAVLRASLGSVFVLALGLRFPTLTTAAWIGPWLAIGVAVVVPIQAFLHLDTLRHASLRAAGEWELPERA